jgi:hypothetical protein
MVYANAETIVSLLEQVPHSLLALCINNLDALQDQHG